MPNVIITSGFANIRAREKERQYGAIAQGIQDTTNIIAQSLLDYRIRKEQEDKERLGILDTMIKTYGSRVGQPVLNEMDHMLQRKGLPGLPKDTVTGAPLPPPETLDQLIRDHVETNPQLLDEAAYKEMTGMSKLQASLKQHELELKTKHEQVYETTQLLRAQAAQERATSSRVSADTNRRLRLMEMELKTRRMEMDQAKVANAFAFKSEAALWNATKAWGSKNTTPEQRKILEPALREALKRTGVPDEDISKYLGEKTGDSWLIGGIKKGWFYLWNRNKPLVDAIDQEHTMRGINSQNIPGARRTKSGKVIVEETEGGATGPAASQQVGGTLGDLAGQLRGEVEAGRMTEAEMTKRLNAASKAGMPEGNLGVP